MLQFLAGHKTAAEDGTLKFNSHQIVFLSVFPHLKGQRLTLMGVCRHKMEQKIHACSFGYINSQKMLTIH